MDGAGDQLLAGAALTADQDRRARSRRLPHQLVRREHPRVATDQFVQVGACGSSSWLPRLLRKGRMPFQQSTGGQRLRAAACVSRGVACSEALRTSCNESLRSLVPQLHLEVSAIAVRVSREKEALRRDAGVCVIPGSRMPSSSRGSHRAAGGSGLVRRGPSRASGAPARCHASASQSANLMGQTRGLSPGIRDRSSRATPK